jgi:hypothetical protein
MRVTTTHSALVVPLVVKGRETAVARHAPLRGLVASSLDDPLFALISALTMLTRYAGQQCYYRGQRRSGLLDFREAVWYEGSRRHCTTRIPMSAAGSATDYVVGGSMDVEVW